MFRTNFKRCGQLQDFVFVKSVVWHHGHQLGFALCQRAGFINDQRVNLGENLQRLGVLDQNTGLCTATGGRHDGHWRGKTKGAGASNDQDRNGRYKGVGQRRIGAVDGPGTIGYDGDQDHGGHKIPRHPIRHFLDRRTTALGVGNHGDDLRQDRIKAHTTGGHDQAAGAVDRGPGQTVAFGFFHRNRFAGYHGFINRGPPFGDHPVRGNFFARSHAQGVSDLDLFQINLFLCAVRADDYGGF